VFPEAQETENVNMWDACRRQPYKPQRRKLLHHVMDVDVAWLRSRTVVNVVEWQTGMHDLEICCDQAWKEFKADGHQQEACYAQQLCTYITNDMHHNPDY